MTCHHVPLPGGAAIFCTPTRRCKCGRRATLLCDWKVPTKRSGTCDRPICDHCTTKPAPDKDICRDHAPALAEWMAAHA